MAKRDKKFGLEKENGSHDFKLNKGSKRQFDLRKDDDEPVVRGASQIIDTDNVTPGYTEPVTQTQVPQPESGTPTEGKKKSAVWIWILVILALLAILFIWLIPGKEKAEEKQVDVPAMEAAATDVTDDEAAIAAQENGEEATTPETAETPANDEAAEPSEPVAPAVEPVTPAPVPEAKPEAVTTSKTSSSVSDDIESEARKVIRGEYGNNPERKSNLGERYHDIQKRVNELKRRGKF